LLDVGNEVRFSTKIANSKSEIYLLGCLGKKPQGEKYAGVFTRLDALIRALCSLPCGVTVQTLFHRLADWKPGAMNTEVVPCHVTAEEAAITIALKHRLALLTAEPVIIAYSLMVVAKHRD